MLRWNQAYLNLGSYRPIIPLPFQTGENINQPAYQIGKVLFIGYVTVTVHQVAGPQREFRRPGKNGNNRPLGGKRAERLRVSELTLENYNWSHLMRSPRTYGSHKASKP